MSVNYTDFSQSVENYRQECRDIVRRQATHLIEWAVGSSENTHLHIAEDCLWTRLMAFGRSLLLLWLSHRLPSRALLVLTASGGEYHFRGLTTEIVRTRFGEIRPLRRTYQRFSGKGPRILSPDDRRIGLVAGRMSLRIHFLVGLLSARLSFDEMLKVMGHCSAYVPGKRASLGIVDNIGVEARTFLNSLGPPDDDGEILIIQVDSKGAPMLRPSEHKKRCQAHKKRPKESSARGLRRIKRHENPKKRRQKGDKSKNARMGNVAVIYTLRKMPDGTLEGPVNRRIIATFGPMDEFRSMLLKEAYQRGYGQKPTVFLADGARWLWCLQKDYFPKATACLDWYHLCEYIWEAGATFYKEGSEQLTKWVQDRKKELRKSDIDAILSALHELWEHHAKNKRASKQKKVESTVNYLLNHEDQLNYKQLIEQDIDISTGAVEGAVKHLIGARLDGQGMRWSIERAEHVLALRLVVINDLWEEFEAFCGNQLNKFKDLAIPSVSPDRPRRLAHADAA